jgi:hypothetical protein
MSVVEVQAIDSLERWVPAWSDLAQNAIEPNPFFEPWAFIPAWRYLASAEESCLFIFSMQQPDLLIGFIPVTRYRSYSGLPLPHLGVWRHRHCYLGVPLIRNGATEQVLEQLFGWLDGRSDGYLGFQFPWLYGDSAIKSNLVRFADQSCCELDEVESFGRAILLPRFDADRYVDQALSGKHKKNLDHKLKGLRELGDVNFQVSYDSLGLSEWLEQFISLEHSGWKSRNGGSLRSSPLEERFFHDLVTCGSKSERIIRQTMTLSQKPIVKRVVLSSGTKTFAFKTAYDEQWSKWSPGMLMELKNLSWALEQETKITMDSCAAPNAELFRRLWLDTCTISSLMLSKQRSTGRIIVSAIAGLRQLKRRGVNLGAHIKPKIHL